MSWYQAIGIRYDDLDFVVVWYTAICHIETSQITDNATVCSTVALCEGVHRLLVFLPHRGAVVIRKRHTSHGQCFVGIEVNLATFVNTEQAPSHYLNQLCQIRLELDLLST